MPVRAVAETRLATIRIRVSRILVFSTILPQNAKSKQILCYYIACPMPLHHSMVPSERIFPKEKKCVQPILHASLIKRIFHHHRWLHLNLTPLSRRPRAAALNFHDSNSNPLQISAFSQCTCKEHPESNPNRTFCQNSWPE